MVELAEKTKRAIFLGLMFSSVVAGVCGVAVVYKNTSALSVDEKLTAGNDSLFFQLGHQVAQPQIYAHVLLPLNASSKEEGTPQTYRSLSENREIEQVLSFRKVPVKARTGRHGKKDKITEVEYFCKLPEYLQGEKLTFLDNGGIDLEMTIASHERDYLENNINRLDTDKINESLGLNLITRNIEINKLGVFVDGKKMPPDMDLLFRAHVKYVMKTIEKGGQKALDDAVREKRSLFPWVMPDKNGSKVLPSLKTQLKKSGYPGPDKKGNLKHGKRMGGVSRGNLFYVRTCG